MVSSRLISAFLFSCIKKCCIYMYEMKKLCLFRLFCCAEVDSGRVNGIFPKESSSMTSSNILQLLWIFGSIVNGLRRSGIPQSVGCSTRDFFFKYLIKSQMSTKTTTLQIHSALLHHLHLKFELFK